MSSGSLWGSLAFAHHSAASNLTLVADMFDNRLGQISSTSSRAGDSAVQGQSF